MDVLDQLLRNDSNAALAPLVEWLRWANAHPQDIPREYEEALFNARSAEDSLWVTLAMGVLVKRYDPAHMPPGPAWDDLWAWMTRNGGWQTGLLWTGLLTASTDREV